MAERPSSNRPHSDETNDEPKSDQTRSSDQRPRPSVQARPDREPEKATNPAAQPMTPQGGNDPEVSPGMVNPSERTQETGPLQSAGPNTAPTEAPAQRVAEQAAGGAPAQPGDTSVQRPLNQPGQPNQSRDAQHVRPDTIGSSNRGPQGSPAETQAASPAVGGTEPRALGRSGDSRVDRIREIAAEALRGQDPTGMANPWQQALRQILVISG